MNTSETNPLEQSRVEVETACGDKTVLNPDTPQAMFNGRPIYFCLVECKTSFEDDPFNSCLADDILEQSS